MIWIGFELIVNHRVDNLEELQGKFVQKSVENHHFIISRTPESDNKP